MQIINSNTKFIFIYTTDKIPEERFLTDIVLCLHRLYTYHFNCEEVILLIDGFNRENVKKYIEEFGIKVPEIRNFYRNYENCIKEIVSENLIVTVTGHGNSITSQLCSSKNNKVDRDSFYNPIDTNEHIKNAIFFWGQCYSGGYKETDCIKRRANYYIFGASDQSVSKSSDMFFKKVQKMIMNDKFERLYEEHPDRFNVNTFLISVMLFFDELINIDINKIQMFAFQKKICESYILTETLKTGNYDSIFSNLQKCDLSKLTHSVLIMHEKKEVETIKQLKEQNNIPWIQIIENHQEHFVQDDPKMEFRLTLLINIIYINILDRISQIEDGYHLEITIEDIAKNLPEVSEDELFNDITYILLSFLVDSNSDIKNHTDKKKIVFIFHRKLEKIPQLDQQLAKEIVNLYYHHV